MLFKPSLAESLVDLQAEMNALKLSDNLKYEDEIMEETPTVGSGWTLSQYFNN